MSGLSWQVVGCAAALGSAGAWALGAILFRRIGDEASPLGMNLGKGLLGLLLLGGALLLTGWQPMDGRTVAFLALSGVVGIALGDTLFFMALVRLDPRLTLLLATVGQVTTVLLAMLFLGERPTLWAWVGIPLVLGGVTWVMAEQLPLEDRGGRKVRLAGVGWGLAASVCISVGFILAKVGLADVSALQGTFWRFAFGMVALATFGWVRGDLCAWLRPFASPTLLRRILGAVAVVTFGGFWLTMVGYKHAPASLATVLMSTEPLFVLPLARVLLAERITPRAAVGAAVAVAGVVAILLGAGAG
ncbi:MAG: DMT family transporter [Pseudomonadota bacterium]